VAEREKKILRVDSVEYSCGQLFVLKMGCWPVVGVEDGLLVGLEKKI
jgi:hypothetical protein